MGEKRDIILDVDKQPVVKIEESCFYVDLTNEDVVSKWDTNIRRQFIKGFVADEYRLDRIMKEYVKSLEEEAVQFQEHLELKAKILSHIKYFHLYQAELNCCFIEKYLENMEDILKVYCDLEVEILTKVRKRGDLSKKQLTKIINEVYKHIVYMLRVFLLNREDHIFNVFIKVNMNPFPKECNQLWTKIYIHFFRKKPVDFSDEAFCRAYIIYQSWKEFFSEKYHRILNTILFCRYGRTEDSISESETLKKVLMPRSDSTLNAISHMSGQVYYMANEYFKHIRGTKSLDVDSSMCLTDDEDMCDTVPVLDYDDDDEDEDILNVCNEVEGMSILNVELGETIEDDDDDVQIISVGVNTPTNDNESSGDVIIIDDGDDDDIVTPIATTADAAVPKAAVMTTKFLDSIELPERPRRPFRRRIRADSDEEAPVTSCPSTMTSYTTCAVATSKMPLADITLASSNNANAAAPKGDKVNPTPSVEATGTDTVALSVVSEEAVVTNTTGDKPGSTGSSTYDYSYGLDTPPSSSQEDDEKDHVHCPSEQQKEDRLSLPEDDTSQKNVEPDILPNTKKKADPPAMMNGDSDGCSMDVSFECEEAAEGGQSNEMDVSGADCGQSNEMDVSSADCDSRPNSSEGKEEQELPVRPVVLNDCAQIIDNRSPVLEEVTRNKTPIPSEPVRPRPMQHFSVSDFEDFQKAMWDSPTPPSPAFEPIDARSLRADFEIEKSKLRPPTGILKKKGADADKKRKNVGFVTTNNVEPLYSLLYDAGDVDDSRPVRVVGGPISKSQIEKALHYQKFVRENSRKQSEQTFILCDYDSGSFEIKRQRVFEDPVTSGSNANEQHYVGRKPGKRKRNEANSSNNELGEYFSKPKRTSRVYRKSPSIEKKNNFVRIFNGSDYC